MTEPKKSLIRRVFNFLWGSVITIYRALIILSVVIFVGLLLWGWLWGIWGLFMGPPLLMMVKAGPPTPDMAIEQAKITRDTIEAHASGPQDPSGPAVPVDTRAAATEALPVAIARAPASATALALPASQTL